MERVEFTTSDGARLVGSLERPPSATAAVLLIHMWPTDRQSWSGIQSMFAEQGIASFAIDLRGHGESSPGDPSMEDVRAGLSVLADYRIGIMGASIGANFAMRAMSERPDIKAGVLLSPGSDYHGITTFDAAPRLQPGQAVLVAASSGDDQQSFEDAQEIIRLVPSTEKVWQPFERSGHAMHLFTSHPEFADTVVTWLSNHLK